MDQGYFTDYNQQPTLEDVRLAIDSAYSLWEILTSFIEDTNQIQGTWNSWGPAKSGWGLRYRRKERSLVALYPQKDRFMAQVVLGKAQAERALRLKLGEQVRNVLKEAPQLRDGRWLSIMVVSQADIEDVEHLLLVKMQPVNLIK